MIKQTITYADADGRSCTEDFYFNLTKAEIVELQISHAGGFAESMQYLVDSRDQQGILRVIKELILKAYGERTDVSRHFVKKPEFAEAFSHTEAYSTLFMSLFEDSSKASAFFEGLMPADMIAEAKKEAAARPATQDHQSKQEKPTNYAEGFKIVELPERDDKRSISKAEAETWQNNDLVAFIQAGGVITEG